MKFIEWFLMLFFRKKAKIVKQEAFIERQEAILNYAKVKQQNEKYLSRFSGKKRYVKTGKL